MATRTKAELEAAADSAIHQNDTGAITPAVHRALLQDILDSVPSGVNGSAERPALAWTAAGRWEAVSDIATQYLAVTREDDFDTIRRSLIHLLTAGGNEGAFPNVPAFVSTRTSSYMSIGGANTSGNDALLSDLWPVGEAAPFVWLLSPSAFGWLDRGRVNVSTRVDNSGGGTLLESLVHFGRLPYQILINGAAYDLGRYQTSLARPVDDAATPDEAALRFQYRYAPPPPAAPTVTLVS